MAAQVTGIDKLNKSNYSTWRIQIEAVLVKNDHWGYVNGNISKPEPPADQTKWIAKDAKAKADIILAMNPSELCHIKHCVTSNDVWIKLQSIYESKGPAKKASLLKQLLFKKMNHNENMAEHLNSFTDTVDKLNELDIKIADDLLTILILYSVPGTYENFRIAIETREKLPTPDELKIKLLEEYEARSSKDNNVTSTEQAYFSKNKNRHYDGNRNPGNKKTSQKNYKCSYCKIKGHSYNQCYKRMKNNENTSSKQQEKSLMALEYAGAAACNNNQSKTYFTVDSGCTSHMVCDESLFFQINKEDNTIVKLATGEITEAQGRGSIRIKVENPKSKNTETIRLDEVLLVPDLDTNLLSVSKALNQQKEIIFDKNEARVLSKNGETILTATRKGDLYAINFAREGKIKTTDSIQRESSSLTAEETGSSFEINKGEQLTKDSPLHTWHLKYGHLNERDLKLLKAKEMVRGINFDENETLSDCKVCIQGKQTKTPFNKKSNFRSKELLNLVHSDLFGPVDTPSLGGSKYCATFTDDKSRYVEVYFLKSKDEVKDAFLTYKAAMEKITGHQIKTLRTDCGLEYCGEDFDNFLKNEGIRREKTAPYSPSSNGTSERLNRTLIEMARCMLIQSGLPISFWSEAVNTACYIRNRSPSRSLEDHKTPYEVMFGNTPCVSYFKIFGQKAFVLDMKHKRKFDVRSKEHIFIGYSANSKSFRFFNPDTGAVIASRNAKFINEFYNSSEPARAIPQQNASDQMFFDISLSPETSETDLPLAQSQNNDLPEQRPRTHPMHLRSRAASSDVVATPPAPSAAYCVTDCDVKQHTVLVQEIEDLVDNDERNLWASAMSEEISALMDNQAFDIVDRPTSEKVLRSQWVLRKKYDADGNVSKFKARLVADGSVQKQGIDFEENYSPVVRLSSLRTLLAYAVENNLKAYALDFTLAYINGKLDKPVFMEIPKGFKGHFDDNKVFLLKRSLYGLKDSGLVWYQTLDKKLKSMNFESLNSDKCVYKFKSDTCEIILLLYVDDVIVLTNDKQQYLNVVSELSKSFKLKDLGKLSYCLGIQFSQTDNSITMNQSKYINDLLVKFNMVDCKPVVSPMDPNCKFNNELCPQTEQEMLQMKNVPFRQLIGSLMYLSVAARPDITFAVNFLSQFNNAPGQQHWIAAKRILRYLKGTRDLGIVYKQTGDPMTAYCDSDFANLHADKKSQSGFLFKFAGSAISWESKKQRSVALSTCESEFMALSECAKESIHQKNLLGELDPDLVKSPITIFCDNQSAIKLMKNPTFHNKTKHIDIRYTFTRDLYEQKDIDILYISSENNCADILTKGLNGPRHNYLCKLMGLDIK